jgi:predicted ATPase
VGKVLEELYGEDVEQVAVQLAHHFQAAGLAEKAITYLRMAGEQARRLSAHEEAIAHFTQALALLETLPQTAERDRQEFYLCIGLGGSLFTTRGQPAAETEAVYVRAYELVRRMPYDPALAPTLSEFYRTYSGVCNVQGRLAYVPVLGEECLRLAQAHNEPILFMAAHGLLGISMYYMGQPEKGRPLCEQAIREYNAYLRGSRVLMLPQDPGVICLSYVGHSSWMVGYAEQAMQHSRTALALSHTRAHPFSIVIACCNLATLHQFRREPQQVHEQATATLALCTQYEFLWYGGWAAFLLGWALAQQGEVEAGIAQMEQSVRELRAIGSGLQSTYYLALLAEAYAAIGQVDKGLSLLDEAVAWMEKHEERYCEAELHRLRGELLLQQATQAKEDAYAEVEACFYTALAVARHQQAKSLELRATVSLCRLWQVQGKRAEAHALLAGIYGWFTEGFDTLDLIEAKALLEALM